MTVESHDPGRAERVELILQKLESLPTLSTIATRLLTLTADDRADVRQVVSLIEHDPSLTTKVLSLCRRADLGLADSIQTVERAVVMLGFEAVRSIVLSVEVYNLFDSQSDDELEGRPLQDTEPAPTSRFDRVGFWKHCIGVATACRMLCTASRGSFEARPAEAFVYGLLHDIGKIALDRLLPRSYDRVVELAAQQQGNIAECERRVIGLDHHTAGRRLAEKWGLPHVIQDVLWLHGQPYSSVPDLPHKKAIGLVSLCDLLVRQQHIGYSGNHTRTGDVAKMAGDLQLDLSTVEAVTDDLHAAVSAESEVLGLETEAPQQLFLESIARANVTLGRINEVLDRRSRSSRRHERVLHAISEFHQQTVPGLTMVSACGQVVASAAREFGPGFYAVFCPTRGGRSWQFCQFHQDGRLIRSQIIDPPPGMETLESFGHDMQVSVGMLGMLPWLSEFVGDSRDVRSVRLLPLRCGWGLSAVLLHDRDLSGQGFSRTHLRALCETWAAAIAAAGQHEGARRLGEQLAESNRILTETQARLAHTQALAALGEMAAGAAHEMNNPLTVISGRTQVLARELEDDRHRTMAEQICEQAHRLSDLISSLRLFAEPPKPQRRRVSIGRMIRGAIAEAKRRAGGEVDVQTRIEEKLPSCWIDDEQVGLALFELIINALQSSPNRNVTVSVHVDDPSNRLVIEVEDDGCGMSAHALAHAFDPFFSDKPAGRQPGLGLSRAQRLIEGHGGTIRIRSEQDGGTQAVILLPEWRPPEQAEQSEEHRACGEDSQAAGSHGPQQPFAA
ncbi:MAG: HDOD domain-containing protein [Planctomycetes bacterium]|nr:HDOD domain-containing protein [Planctomycetota bacterium]